MFFNDVYDNEEIVSESFAVDEFEVEMLAEEMTGDLSDALQIIMESDQEFFNLQEKMMKLEHCAIVTENMDLLSEGKEGFKEKVQGGFAAMKTRVSAFFKKLKEWIASVIKSDTKFLQKYEPVLKRSNKTTDFGYTLNTADLTSTVGKIAKLRSDMSASIKKKDLKLDKGAVADNAAKQLGFSSNKSMKSEFSEIVKKEGTKITGKVAIKLIKEYKVEKDAIDKMEKETNAFFDYAIAQTKIDGGDDSGKKVAVLKTYCNVLTNYLGIIASALKERKNAARAAAARIASGKDEKAAKEKKEEKPADDATKSESGNILDRF